MKELVSLAASHLSAFADSQPLPLTEVVLMLSEPEYAFDVHGELVKQRGLSQVRFIASSEELREVARTLTLWADERDILNQNPT